MCKKYQALALLGGLFLASTVNADEFDDAVKVCNSFKKMDQIIDCELATPRIISITVDTN